MTNENQEIIQPGQAQEVVFQQGIAGHLQQGADLSNLSSLFAGSPVVMDAEERLQALKYIWRLQAHGLAFKQQDDAEQQFHLKTYRNAVEPLCGELRTLEKEYERACAASKSEIRRANKRAYDALIESIRLNKLFKPCWVQPENFRDAPAPIEMVDQVVQRAKELSKKVRHKIDREEMVEVEGILFKWVFELYKAVQAYTYKYNDLKKDEANLAKISEIADQAGDKQETLLREHFGYESFPPVSSLSVEEAISALAQAIVRGGCQAELKMLMEGIAKEAMRYNDDTSETIIKAWENLITDFSENYSNAKARILAVMFERRVSYAIEKRKVSEENERDLLNLAQALKNNDFLAVLKVAVKDSDNSAVADAGQITPQSTLYYYDTIFKGRYFEILAFIRKNIIPDSVSQDLLEKYFPNTGGPEKAKIALANNLRIWEQYKALPEELRSIKAYPNLSRKLEEFRQFLNERCEQFLKPGASDSLTDLRLDLFNKLDHDLFPFDGADSLQGARDKLRAWLKQPFSSGLEPSRSNLSAQCEWVKARQDICLSSLETLLSPVGEVMSQIFNPHELERKQKFFQDLIISANLAEFSLDNSPDSQVLKQADVFLQYLDLQEEKKCAEGMDERLAIRTKALIAEGEYVAEKAKALAENIQGKVPLSSAGISGSLKHAIGGLYEIAGRLSGVSRPAEPAFGEAGARAKALTSEISRLGSCIAPLAVLNFSDECVPCEKIDPRTQKTSDYVYFAERGDLYRFPVATGEMLNIKTKEGRINFQPGRVYQIGPQVLISKPRSEEAGRKNPYLSVPEAFEIKLQETKGKKTLVFPRGEQDCEEVTADMMGQYDARYYVFFALEGKVYRIRNNESGKGFEFKLDDDQTVCLEAGATYEINHTYHALPFSTRVAQGVELKLHDFEYLVKQLNCLKPGYTEKEEQKRLHASYFDTASFFEQNVYLLAHILDGIAQVKINQYKEGSKERRDVERALVMINKIAEEFSSGRITYRQVLSTLFASLTSSASHTESRKIYAKTLQSFLKGLVHEKFCQEDLTITNVILDKIIDFQHGGFTRAVGTLKDGLAETNEYNNELKPESKEAAIVKQTIESLTIPANKWCMPNVQLVSLSPQFSDIEERVKDAETRFQQLIAEAKAWLLNEPQKPGEIKEKEEFLYFLKQWEDFAGRVDGLKQSIEGTKKLPENKGLPTDKSQALTDHFSKMLANLEERIDAFKVNAEGAFKRMESQCLEYSHPLVIVPGDPDGLYNYFKNLWGAKRSDQQHYQGRLQEFYQHLPYLEYPFLSPKARQDLVEIWFDGLNAEDSLEHKILQTFINHEMRDPGFAVKFERQRKTKIEKLGSDYLSHVQSYISSAWGHPSPNTGGRGAKSIDQLWQDYESAHQNIPQEILGAIDDKVQRENIVLALDCFHELLTLINNKGIAKTETHEKQIKMVLDAVNSIFSSKGGVPNLINTLGEVRQQIKESFIIRDPYKNDALFRFCADKITALNGEYQAFVSLYRRENNELIDSLLDDSASVSIKGLWHLIQETHATGKPPALLFGKEEAEALAAKIIKNKKNIINQANGNEEPWASFINYLIEYEKDGENIKGLIGVTRSLKYASTEQAGKYFIAVDDALTKIRRRHPGALVSDPENPGSQITAEEVVHRIDQYLLKLNDSNSPNLIDLVFKSNNYPAVIALYKGLQQAQPENSEKKLFEKAQKRLRDAFWQLMKDIKAEPGKHFNSIIYLINCREVFPWSDAQDMERIHADLQAIFSRLLDNDRVLSDKNGEIAKIASLLEIENFKRLPCMKGFSRNQFYIKYAGPLEKFYKAWVMKFLSTKAGEGEASQKAKYIQSIIVNGIKVEVNPEPYDGSKVRGWIREALLKGEIHEGDDGNLPIIMQEKLMMDSIIHHIDLDRYFSRSANLNKYIFQYASPEQQEEYVAQCLLKMTALKSRQAPQFIKYFSTLLNFNPALVFTCLKHGLPFCPELWDSLFAEYNNGHDDYSEKYLKNKVIINQFYQLCSPKNQERFQKEQEADKWANEMLEKLVHFKGVGELPQILEADKAPYLSRKLRGQLQVSLKAMQARVEDTVRKQMVEVWQRHGDASSVLQALQSAADTLQPVYLFRDQMISALDLPQDAKQPEAVVQPRFSGTSFAEAACSLYEKICGDLRDITKLQASQALQAFFTQGSAEELAWLVFTLSLDARQQLLSLLERANLPLFGASHPVAVIGNALIEALKAREEEEICRVFNETRMTTLKTAYAQMSVLRAFAMAPKSYEFLTQTTPEQFAAMKAPNFEGFRKEIVKALIRQVCDWRREDESSTGPIKNFTHQAAGFIHLLGDVEGMQEVQQARNAQVAREAAIMTIQGLDKLCGSSDLDAFAREYVASLPIDEREKADAGLAAQQADILKRFEDYLHQKITSPLTTAFEDLENTYHCLQGSGQLQVKSDLQQALQKALWRIVAYLDRLLDDAIAAELNPINHAVFNNLLDIASKLYRLLGSTGLDTVNAEPRNVLIQKAMGYLNSNTACLASPVFIGMKTSGDERNLSDIQRDSQIKKLVAAYNFIAGLAPLEQAGKALEKLKPNFEGLASYFLRHSVVNMAADSSCVFRYDSYQELASAVRVAEAQKTVGQTALNSNLRGTFPHAATFKASERNGSKFKESVSEAYLKESHELRLARRIKAYLQIIDRVPEQQSYYKEAMEVAGENSARLLSKLQNKFFENMGGERAHKLRLGKGHELPKNFLDDLIKVRQQQKIDYQGLPKILFDQLEEEMKSLYGYHQYLLEQRTLGKPYEEAKTALEKEQDYILWLVEHGSMREALIALQPVITLQPNICYIQNEFYKKLHVILNHRLQQLLTTGALCDVQIVLQIVFAMQPDTSGVLKEFWKTLRPLIMSRLACSSVGSPDFKLLTDPKSGLLAMLETDKAAKLLGEEYGKDWVKMAFLEQDKKCAAKIEEWLSGLVGLIFKVLMSPEPVSGDELLSAKIEALMPVRSFSMHNLPDALAGIEQSFTEKSKMTPAIRNLLTHIHTLNNKYASRPVDSELTVELKRIKDDLAILVEETRANKGIEAIKDELFNSLVTHLGKKGLKPKGLKSLEEIPACKPILTAYRHGRELTEAESLQFKAWLESLNSEEVEDIVCQTLLLYQAVEASAKDSIPKKIEVLLARITEIRQDESSKKYEACQEITIKAQKALEAIRSSLPSALIALDKLPLNPVMPLTVSQRTVSSRTFDSVQSKASFASDGGSYLVGGRAGHEFDSDSDLESQDGSGSQSRAPSPVEEVAAQADKTEAPNFVEQKLVSVKAGR
jgi:hypothetical protein